MLPDYEKLGVFYLGKRKQDNSLLLYDSSDLVTHAVCVGMTGSGKTGLCIGLLEEAAIDGIPAIIIDPKGDLSNLLLTFPALQPQDFEPWVNAGEARAQNLTPAAFAAQQADLWKTGLAAWNEDGGRIARLRAAADFTIYTPGSSAGRPVSVLKSFAAPSDAILNDREALRDQISSTATALLGLIGITADPMKSREHVLLSNLLDFNWRSGVSPDLPALIAQIQKPPMPKIGVLDMESFYPAKERFDLAMSLNNLLASPGFDMWLSGDPLDISQFLWTATGKPRLSIFSIAHLSDSERMFFVSLLLNQTLAWVRTQPGTSSLRAILYMDEIFGYFPPVANPPSKPPLLTLLKQARAFGLGIVLATQNPADLDYKGLANTGTWFLGRLQTERDKARVLDGLEGAASHFDRAATDKLLSSLGKRVFLMNNVHDKEPVVFETRWTLSYLRGPLARPEIQKLMHPSEPAAAAVVTSPPPIATAAAPVLPPGIPQYFFPIRGIAKQLTYSPCLVGAAKLQFLDDNLSVDVTRDLLFTTSLSDSALPADWDAAVPVTDCVLTDLEQTPEAGVAFAELPAAAANPKNYTGWNKNFATWLFRTQKIDLMHSPSLNQTSKPGETERDFRVRLQQLAREQRDQVKAALQNKYGPKLEQLQHQKLQAQQHKEAEQQQSSAQILNTVAAAGAGILGAFLGRKTFSVTNINKATQAVRAAGRAAKEYGDVTRAAETIDMLDKQMAGLNAQFNAEVAALDTKIDPTKEIFDTLTVRPKKTSITVQLLALAWRANV